VDEELDAEQVRADVEQVMGSMNDKAQRTLRAYYFGNGDESAVDIGARFGVSGSRVTDLFRALVKKVNDFRLNKLKGGARTTPILQPPSV
jgi:DNA-directed RNA polymerase specialized sigma subunit